MLNLNLLPPEEKKNLKYLMQTRALVVVGGAFVAVFYIFLVLLLPTIFSLSFQKAEALRAGALEEAGQERAGISKVAGRVREINRLADVVMQTRDPYLADLLNAVFRDAPALVRIQAIRLHGDTRELTIEGYAKTRQDMLAFVSALQADARFSDASAPVSSLVKESDITFSIRAKLK